MEISLVFKIKMHTSMSTRKVQAKLSFAQSKVSTGQNMELFNSIFYSCFERQSSIRMCKAHSVIKEQVNMDRNKKQCWLVFVFFANVSPQRSEFSVCLEKDFSDLK